MEGNEDDQGAGASLICRKAGGVGVV